MKYILFLLITLISLNADSYIFSGGKTNTAHFIAKEILTKAYTKANIPVSFKLLNLQESLQKSNAGIYDGEISRIKDINKHYTNLRIIPISTIEIQAVAFSKNKKSIINSYADLEGKNFAIVRGAKFIETATKDYAKTYKKNFYEALESLNNNEIDIIVCPKLAALSIIYKKKYTNIHIVSQSLQNVKLYHFVHKKNTHLIPIITPILQQMQKSKELEYIKQKFLRQLIVR